MDFTDRVALVTGGSMGLGRRFALDLAAAGATVIVCARGADALREVDAELTELRPGSWTRALDVGDTAAVRAFIGEIIDRHGRLDIVINNAAIEERSAVLDMDDALVARHMRINFDGTVAAILAAVPHMVARGEGWIVGVTSGAARAPLPNDAPYAASKAALTAFCESISYELEPLGVKVKVLSPGFVADTRMAIHSVETGLPVPPRAVHRTAEQVSRTLLRNLDGSRFEINATRLEALAPVTKGLAPSMFRRNVKRMHR